MAMADNKHSVRGQLLSAWVGATGASDGADSVPGGSFRGLHNDNFSRMAELRTGTPEDP